MKLIIALSSAGMLSGCVAAALPLLSTAVGGATVVGGNAWARQIQNNTERRQMTALAIGNDLNPRLIEVSRATKDGEAMRWSAQTAIGSYDCSALEGRMTATCAKR